MEAARSALLDSATNLKNLSLYCKSLSSSSDPSTALSTSKQYAIDALVGVGVGEWEWVLGRDTMEVEVEDG